MFSLELLARTGVQPLYLKSLIKRIAENGASYKVNKNVLTIYGPTLKKLYELTPHKISTLPSPFKMVLEGMPRSGHLFLSLESIYKKSKNPSKYYKLETYPRVQEAGKEKGLEFKIGAFPKTTSVAGKFGSARGGPYDIRALQFGRSE